MATNNDNLEQIAVQLNHGYVLLLSNEDADLVKMKWQTRRKDHRIYVYIVQKPYIKRKGTTVYIHRLIIERMLGRDLTSTDIVDHIDGNPLNNTRHNLRVGNQAQNARNAKLSVTNKTGYKGVMVIDGYYKAKITVNYESLDLGRYANAVDAAIAYNHAAVKHFGEYAKLNDIPGWETIEPQMITRYNSLLKNNKSGHTGIHMDKNKWRVVLRKNGTPCNVGTFSTLEQAIEAKETFLRGSND